MKKVSIIIVTLALFDNVSNAEKYLVDGIWYTSTGEVTFNGDTYTEADPNRYQGDIIIPEKVTPNKTEYTVRIINDYAFYGCPGLTSVTLPQTITTIYRYAFDHCDNLKSITCLRSSPPSTYDYQSLIFSSEVVLYVESVEAKKQYEANYIWKNAFAKIFVIGHDDSTKPSGEGTELQPYVIKTADELEWFRVELAEHTTNVLYAILDADISLNGATWTPIGTQARPFNGHFEGRNHYISDFSINKTGEDDAHIGLFGYAENASIKTIKVRDASVKGNKYTGIICGYAKNTDIVACDNYATVEGKQYTGGICGYLDNAKISNCSNGGEVKSSGDYTGGVAGFLNSAVVESCVNNKSVSSTGQYTGGVAGTIGGSGSTITTCSSAAEATVNGTNYTGGLIGNVTGGATISNCLTYGAVSGTGQEVGGMIGTLDGSTALNLSNYGRVESSSTQVGGLIGSSKNSSVLQYCANAGDVIAEKDRNVGGLIGNASATSLTSCINSGVIRGKDYTGGLVGYHYEGSNMQYCANYGPVSGNNYVGGLTGESRANMKESFSVGRVTGSGSQVGGITGSLYMSLYADNLLYDNQLCPLEDAFGTGSGAGEGVSTAELTGVISDFETSAWTMADGLYPRPTNLATLDIAVVGASTVFFASGDDADHFAHEASLTTVKNSKWSAKGGTQINGTTAKPAIIGADTLYVAKTSAVKAVPVNVTASLVQQYTLSVTAGAGGTVDNAGGQYAEGTQVTITAIPDTKYHFLNWSDSNTDNPRTITMDKNYTLQAFFEKDPPVMFNVSVTAGDGGSVNELEPKYEEGSTITLTATPDAGYKFVEWDDHNTENPREIVVTADVTLKALFEELPPAQYDIVISAGAGGTVDNAGGTFVVGTEIVVTATPNDEDHRFVKWSDDVTDNPRTIIVEGDLTLEAQFEAIPYYTLTITSDPGGSVNTAGGSYKEGTSVELEATPSSGFHFRQWKNTETDEVYSTESKITVEMTADLSLKAIFSEIKYVNVLVINTVGGTVNTDASDNYEDSSIVPLNATPDTGYEFLRWSDGATENPYDFVVGEEDITIFAIFSSLECAK